MKKRRRKLKSLAMRFWGAVALVTGLCVASVPVCRVERAPASEDYYAELGIGRNARPEAIVDAYVRMRDLHGADPARLKRIEHAYAVLGSKTTRDAYHELQIWEDKPRGKSDPFAEDFYDRLGVPASEFEGSGILRIEMVYKAALVEHAADVDALLRLGEAWEILSNPANRRRYNAGEPVELDFEATRVAAIEFARLSRSTQNLPEFVEKSTAVLIAAKKQAPLAGNLTDELWRQMDVQIRVALNEDRPVQDFLTALRHIDLAYLQRKSAKQDLDYALHQMEHRRTALAYELLRRVKTPQEFAALAKALPSFEHQLERDGVLAHFQEHVDNHPALFLLDAVPFPPVERQAIDKPKPGPLARILGCFNFMKMLRPRT